MKKCSRCGVIKPLSTDYFGKRKVSIDGYYGQCTKCRSEVKRIRLQKIAKEGGEDFSLRNKRYYERHYEENKERILKRNKRYYEENKERILKRQREQRQENKEEIARRNKEYKEKNPHIYRIANQVRRAREKEVAYTLSQEQWLRILKDFNCSCAYCGISEKESLFRYNECLHQEHFVPLTKGGGYTHNNIIPACKSCNSSKHNKNFFEWYSDYEHYSKEREDFILKYLNYKENNIQQLSIL